MKEEKIFDLSRIHAANLEILRAVRDICERHDITYLIDSGTLLGAVRHHGFIPWDDDIDLCFRREDFECFTAFARAELPSHMQLVLPNEYRGGEAFYDFVPRVLYLPSRRHAEEDADMQFYEGKLNHLWVDIFLLDRLPERPLAARMMKLKQQIAFGLGMAHRRSLDWSRYHGLQRLEVQVLVAIGRFLPMPLIFRLQERWARRYTDRYGKKQAQQTDASAAHPEESVAAESGHSFFSNYQPDFQYCTVEDDWEEPIPFLFEGESFTGPRAWDRVLRMLYGDYMKLPRPEDRHPSHSGQELEILDPPFPGSGASAEDAAETGTAVPEGNV